MIRKFEGLFFNYLKHVKSQQKHGSHSLTFKFYRSWFLESIVKPVSFYIAICSDDMIFPDFSMIYLM